MAVTEGAGSNEGYSVIGDFREMLFGMRTSGIVLRRLPAGQVIDQQNVTHNAPAELKEFLVAYLRADVAILRPTWFTVSQRRHLGLTSEQKGTSEMNITSQNKFTRVSNAAAAGNGDTLASATSSTRAGLSSVLFLVSLGTAGTGKVKVQDSADTNTSNFSDVAGSGYTMTNAASNSLVLVELADPRKRYARAAVVRDANSNTTLNCIIAIQGKAQVEPVSDGNTVVSLTLLASPADGNA